MKLECITERSTLWGNIRHVASDQLRWAYLRPGDLVTRNKWPSKDDQLGTVIANINTWSQEGLEIWVLWSVA